MILGFFSNKSSQQGFTLAEILVVIAVVGLLSSVIFAIVREAGEQGRIAKGLYFSQHLHNSLGSYIAGAWTFDEGSGIIANDTSGWGNHGTISGATHTADTSSSTGYALSFDGVNDRIILNNAVLTPSAITVEFWWKRSGPAGGNSTTYHHVLRYLAGASGSNANSFYIFSGGDRALFRLTIGGVIKDVTIAGLNVNGWNHLVGTWDGSNIYGFVNGVSTDSLPATGVLSTGTTPLNIGRLSDYVVNGLVDEVRIYETALTSAQIEAQYYAGLHKLLSKGLMSEEEYQERLVKI